MDRSTNESFVQEEESEKRPVDIRSGESDCKYQCVNCLHILQQSVFLYFVLLTFL